MVRSERQNREVAMRNIRIGVVEDDPASCQLVLDYLNRYQQENGEQFTVSVFDDGARIVEKYTPVYDILLLDIEMSEMDGMAAARRIRERDDKVVIVFITAAPQYAISGYEVRALSYLLKPLPWFAFSQELKKSIDMVRRNGDDSAWRGHRQTRRPVYYGTRVRAGRIGSVAALADRYVHWHARWFRRLRLACNRAAGRYVCIVLQFGLAG